MKDILALDKRREIYNYIMKYPGAHFSEIKDNLCMPTGVLQHHLGILEKMELISHQMEGTRKRYFVRTEVPLGDRKMLAFVRLKRNRDILIYILERRAVTFKDLLGRFNISKSTLSFYMKRLGNAGLIVEGMAEREKTYSAFDPNSLASILITYRESFLDDAVDRFVDVWTEL